VALGVACGCGGAQRVHPAGADYLDAIRIEGNRAVATGALEPALALHETIREGAAMDPYLLAADTERIRIAYWKRGFFEARVAARVERSGHAQTVVFAVVEGRRAATRVEIDGLPPELPLARARALVELDDGAPFDYEVYEAGKQALDAAVQDAGYAHVEVPATVLADAAAATATVRYAVAAGARCRFGAIRVTGTARPELVAAVRRRLTFATGDRYSASALEESEAQLYELGRFSTVQLVPDRAGGEAIDVTVELTESSRHELHGGGGLFYDRATYEGRARGGFSVVPASQPLLTIATELRAAATIPHDFDTGEIEPKVRGLASLQRLDLLVPRVRGELAGGVDYQTVEAYRWTGAHVRLGLDAPLGRSWLRFHLGWLLQHLEFSGVNDVLLQAPAECPPREPPCPTTAEQLGLVEAHAAGTDPPPGRQRLGAYQASLTADLRDNPIEPRRGVYLDLRAAAGTRFAGGELRYLQLVPELRGYVSLGGVVIAGRARVGAIFGDVPVTERYYSGGTSAQRGFDGRRLSPTATAIIDDETRAVVIGGAGLIETGVELRRRLGTLATWPIGGNLFLDGGDVTETPEQLDPWNLHWAVGAGLWSKLGGVLKFRFEVGYRLNRTDPPDPLSVTSAWDKLAFQLGVGENY
jgi:translocation and assembly module TamA